LQAEAEAGLAAVEGAAATGLNRVIFESDSKNLVSALRDRVLLKEMRSICTAWEGETQDFVSELVASDLAGHSG
jgi:ribonuclease HI